MEFGYLDPGSGSMILQAILGGLAGIAVAFKMFGHRLWSMLTFWRRDEKAPSHDTPASTGAHSEQEDAA
jgi:hypothetical protein